MNSLTILLPALFHTVVWGDLLLSLKREEISYFSRRILGICIKPVLGRKSPELTFFDREFLGKTR